ncbi:hypothetical protein [Paenibacillus xylanexedens]|uniref:hypothetical protein n=1 Tax=Paenibacillus xylanexedens TaxID=528191 RepID=UPI0011A4048D|nr:hypothetical protein [Paenibacillus xylanexedens]
MDWPIAIFSAALSLPLAALIKYGFKYLAERSLHHTVSQTILERSLELGQELKETRNKDE